MSMGERTVFIIALDIKMWRWLEDAEAVFQMHFDFPL